MQVYTYNFGTEFVTKVRAELKAEGINALASPRHHAISRTPPCAGSFFAHRQRHEHTTMI